MAARREFSCPPAEMFVTAYYGHLMAADRIALNAPRVGIRTRLWGGGVASSMFVLVARVSPCLQRV